MSRALQHAALLLGMLAPAVWAACPPAGETTATLQALKAEGWQRPDLQADPPRQALALALLDCLADPDPALRDGIAFEALQAWMRGGRLGTDTLHAMRGRLLAMLAAPADAAGFAQPFAALVLAELARVDRLKPWLSTEERDALVDAAVRYLAGVRDYRGYDEREGWRHGVAHGADLMLQLALNPALRREQALRMLDAIAQQVLPPGAQAWRYGEPSRLAAPVYFLARRDLLTAADWQRWLQGLSASRPAASASVTQASLAARHNLGAFLAGLYLVVQESSAPEPKAHLLPALRETLRAVD